MSQRRSSSADSATRDRLLAATTNLIARDGIAAATSRRITDEAGVNLAAITYWFGSKENLVDAALRDQVAALVEPALTILEGDGDPVTRLAAAVRYLLSTFAERQGQSAAYLTALLEATRHSDPADPTRAVVARVRERLAAVNAELVASGAVPGWVDPDAMAALIIAAGHGIALQSTLDPDGPTVESQAAQLAGLLIAARPDDEPTEASGPRGGDRGRATNRSE